MIPTLILFCQAAGRRASGWPTVARHTPRPRIGCQARGETTKTAPTKSAPTWPARAGSHHVRNLIRFDQRQALRAGPHSRRDGRRLQLARTPVRGADRGGCRCPGEDPGGRVERKDEGKLVCRCGTTVVEY